MSMTHGQNGTRTDTHPPPPRPPSAHSSHSSSGSGSAKHVKCIGRYVLTGHNLGKGNFARVESGVHSLTGAKVAIKIIETDKIKEEYVRKNLLREAQLMRRLHHPNIIRLYETMKTHNLYCLVTEVAEGGELLSHVRNDFKEKRLSEAATRPFIRQLVSALHHLHSAGIAHRDLKMENILLDKRKRNIKIVDFGLSNAQKPGSLLQTHCGSPEYAAPELFIPGREYGPEVDVWSLGVNMYAMLVGKLPFRSPRQGTKRRQKLLEQIAGGLAESHEKEMAHVSKGARDLIGRLLTPDSKRRVRLEEVMQHPWITKEGTQPLGPFKLVLPDAATTHSVIELMSTVLHVPAGDIKETVRRDRCDWLAAIYNLMMDQPEGRNILQRLINSGPEDQLTDAAHYDGSMEHLRLSQADALDQLPPSADVITALTMATAQSRRTGYRHSLGRPPLESGGDYASATLPLTKKEKRRHHSDSGRPLAATRAPLNPVQPPPYMRRASIASPYVSPEHQQIQANLVPSERVSHDHHGGHMIRGRRLPVTPNEEPYQRQHDLVMRPHSRAESAPDPLPVPWRPKIATQNQLMRPQEGFSPNSSPPKSPPNPTTEEHHQLCQNFKEPLATPLGHSKPSGHVKKSKLNPLSSRPRSVSHNPRYMSASIDANLHLRTGGGSGGHNPQQRGLSYGARSWKQRSQVGPYSDSKGGGGFRRVNMDDSVPLGWPSAPYIPNPKIGQGDRKAPADIQHLMSKNMPYSPYNSVQDIPHEIHRHSGKHHVADTYMQGSGSTTSVEIRNELFSLHSAAQGDLPQSHTPSGLSPQSSSKNFVTSSDNFKVDPISGGELSQRSHHNIYHDHKRSVSAKPTNRQTVMDHRMPQEFSASANYIGYEHHNGTPVIYTNDDTDHERHRDEDATGKRGNAGLLARFKKSSQQKSAGTTISPTVI